MLNRILSAMVLLCVMGSAAQAAPTSSRTRGGAVSGARVAGVILEHLDTRLEQRRRGTLINDIRGNVSVDSTYVVPLVWNGWAEEGVAAPTFEAAPFLKPNTPYWVMLDLSAMAYWRRSSLGTYSTAAGEPFINVVRAWMRTSQSEVRLDVVPLPDSDFFTLISAPRSALQINLDKVRRASRDTSVLGRISDPVDDLRKNGDRSPVMFGRVQFQVRTQQRLGITSIHLSLWDRGRPIEQISLPFCVAPDEAARIALCRGSPTSTDSLEGIDSLRTTAEGAVRPDAAFHYVEVGGRVYGVFKRNDCAGCKYVTFDVPFGSLQQLQQTVAAIALPAFAAAADDETRARVGAQIYDALVPPRGVANPADEDVQAEFSAFMQAARARPPSNPASVFIRMVGQSLSGPTLLPFALIAPPDTGGGPARLLGAWARIELPLSIQSYAPVNECIDNWAVAVDPALPESSSWTRIAARVRGSDVFNTMPRFSDWLRMDESAKRTGVFVVGHQAQGRMYFSDTPADAVTPYGIRRQFERPGFALLNGCSTANPEAVTPELLRYLNFAGMSSVIATWTPVADDMAADYLDCFAEAVTAARSDAERSLAAIHSKALTCLAPTWGSRAYTYTLFGNSAVRVCTPRNTR